MPVGQLDRDRRQVDAAGLLEVGELRDLLPVEQHLPADAPRPERRRFPVVFFEPHVVRPQIDPACLEALQVELLHLVGRRLQDDLELLVLEQPVGVLTEAAVGGPTRRLDVRDVPWFRPQHAQERLGMHRPGAHLDVEWLVQQAAARGPELRELEDELLQRDHSTGGFRRPSAVARGGPVPRSAPAWRLRSASILTGVPHLAENPD